VTAGCRFCAIVAGDLDAQVVYEDDQLVAFLDHRPLFPGHTLVVPRAHVETLPEVPADLLTPLFVLVQRVAQALVDALGAEGSFVGQNNRVSQSVPHLHVHVVPRRRKDGLRGFFWPRHPYEGDAHMAEVAATLRRALQEPSAPVSRSDP